MNRVLRSTVTRALAAFDLDISRRSDQRRILSENETLSRQYRTLSQQYCTLVSEFHGCLAEMVFPDLVPGSGRQELLARLIGTPVPEAIYLIAHLHKVLGLEGDVCEFGIAQGATSALLANEIRATPKHLWLFDSFKGLGRPGPQDSLVNDIFNLGSIERYEGTMACDISEVLSRLTEISFELTRVHIVAGFIEDTIKQTKLPETVCFAYVDFDFYNPIIVALRFLAERLAPAGIVIVDDYGFFSSGAKTAVDEFMREQGDHFEMTLPREFAARTTPFCILRKISHG